MEDPNAARPGNWEEGPHGLVRPYLGPGDDDTDGSPDAMGGSGGRSVGPLHLQPAGTRGRPWRTVRVG